MKQWKKFSRFGLIFSLSLGMTMTLVPMRTADGSKSQTGRLEGTWFTQVTIRDCHTGVVLRTFSPSLRSTAAGR